MLSVIYQRLKFNSEVTKAPLISYCSLPLKNQLLRRAGIQAGALLYFYVLFTRRLFKRVLNQDQAVKRAYTVQ